MQPSAIEALLASAHDSSGGLTAIAGRLAHALAADAGCGAAEIWLWRLSDRDDRRIQRVGSDGASIEHNGFAASFVDWLHDGPWKREQGADGTELVHVALGLVGFVTLVRRAGEPAVGDAALARIAAQADAIGHRLIAQLPAAEIESSVRWLLRSSDFDRRAARMLASARSLEDLGRMLDLLSGRLFELEYSGIYFLDPSTTRLRLVVGHGLNEAERQRAERTAAQRHPGEVIRTGRAVDIEDTSADSEAVEPEGHGRPIRSRLYLPVRSGDAVVGAIGFASAQPRSFGRRHHQALSFLADLAGATYGRLQAQREIERRGQLIEACSIANERLLAASDWHAAATAALALVGGALGARALALIRLSLADHDQDEDFIWQPVFGAPWPLRGRASQPSAEDREKLAAGSAVEWVVDGSALVVKPLLVDGELWGVLVCEVAEGGPRGVTRAERSALRALASGFCAAIVRERSDRIMRERQKQDAVSRLASGIAHDFNNLLWPVLLYSDMLERAPSMDARSRQMLRDMRLSASRASELVQQMFAIARSSDGVVEVVNIGELAVEVAATVRRSAPASAQINAAIDSDAGHVLGDGAAIRELVMQVFAHALEALEGQPGEITATLERIERDRGSWVRLAVIDNGSMPRAKQLALTAAHRIAKDHRGELSVRSAQRHGTIREVFLPIALREYAGEQEEPTIDELEAEIKSAEDAAAAVERVLLVDDDAAVLEVARQILESIGYEVVARNRAQAAVDVLSDPAERISLLLTDIAMPGMDGLSLAREAKRLRPALPIVCCTGFGDARSERTAAEIGVAAFIRKPIDFDLYAKTIRAAIDGSRRGRGEE